MKVFQQLSAGCSCAVCRPGCLCGDCAACSNRALDRSMLRNARRLSALAVLAIVLSGFVYYAPVVTLGATPVVTQTFSMKFQQANRPSSPLGSLSFCLLGQGAVLINGTYYPNAALNQSQRRICSS